MAGGYAPNIIEARYLRWFQCSTNRPETKLTVSIRATAIDIAQLVQEQGMFPTNRNIHDPSRPQHWDHLGNVSLFGVIKTQLAVVVASHSPGLTLGVQ